VRVGGGVEVLVGCGGGEYGGDGYGGGKSFFGRLLGGGLGNAGWDFWRVGLRGIGRCQVSAL